MHYMQYQLYWITLLYVSMHYNNVLEFLNWFALFNNLTEHFTVEIHDLCIIKPTE